MIDFKEEEGKYGRYHQEGPDGVVEEDHRGGHEHGEADEFVELWLLLLLASFDKWRLRVRQTIAEEM
jgi:hypothetical protein